MATIGPLYVGTGASYNDGGTTTWTNPTNFQGDTTSTSATCNITSNGGTSYKLRGSNFGFTGLGGATITGITVEVEASAPNNNRHYWNNVQLLKGGTETGDNKSDGTAIFSKALKTFGSSSDNWNAGLVGADVMSTGFGISVKVSRNSTSATTTNMFRARITVEHTPASFTANAVIRKTMTPTGLTADAVRLVSMPGSTSLNAIQLRTYSPSITADAICKATMEPAGGIDQVDAIILANSGTQTLAADAVLLATMTGAIPPAPSGFWVDYEWTTGATVVPGDFAADAIVIGPCPGSATADAVILAGSGSLSATIDAVLLAGSGTRTVQSDAILIASSGSLPIGADAVLLASLEMPFPADGILTREMSGAASADAITARTFEPWLTADGVVLEPDVETPGFTLDCQVLAIAEGALVTDAITLASIDAHFHIDYQWSSTGIGSPVWTTPADGIGITSTPSLAFTMPATSRPLHFHMELDRVDTFDGADLRQYKSHFDQTGWEYWDGGAWQPVPSTGVPDIYAGNEARFNVSAPLAAGTWYRRVRAGAV